MKIATHVARFFQGAVFLVFGLNGFFNFIQLPPMPEAATDFLGALVKTGYLMTLVKATPAELKKMADAAKAAGVETVYGTVPGGTHLEAYLTYASQIFDFLDSHRKMAP